MFQIYKIIFPLGFALLVTAFSIIAPLSAYSMSNTTNNPIIQDTSTSTSTNLPRVYLDCNDCDKNYIREEIRFVNYVRDHEQGNIHIFITSTRTGGGGGEYEVSFIGRKKYDEKEFELIFNTERNATSDQVRSKMVGILKKGLLPFMVESPLNNSLSVKFDESQKYSRNTYEIDDPWNHWTFELYAGSLELNLESNQKSFGSRWGIYADHVTEDWKARIRPYFNYHYEEIKQGEGKEPVVSRRHRHGFNSYLIKSLDQHWSAGIFGNYVTREDRNLRHDVELRSGIEYSLFPYSEATRKAITFSYRIGYKGRDYYEETIFQENQEHLINHSLNIGSRIQQPWGTVEANIEGSNYFHDISKARAEIFGLVSVRVTEGFSIDFMTNYEIIRDQLSLPAGETSLEDIILAQRELATNYELYTSIALTYTFGSEFTNVVNTRF